MFTETTYRCATCGSTDGCTCRLLDKSMTAEKVIAETERDFATEPLGARVRRPKGIVELCPLCAQRGVHVIIPRWRRRPGRDQWIHEARVSSVGYEVIESCEREIPLKRGRK